VTSHSVPLSGLSPSTTYHYKITSQTSAGDSASTGDLTFTTAPPPLTISNPAAGGITTTGATITWTTNLASDSRVDYGTTTAYGSFASNPSAVTSHSVALSGLSPSTTYHYKITSQGYGQTATTLDLTFTTADPPLAISNPAASSVTATSATITWTTNKAANGRVDYGTSTAYGSTATNTAMVTSHSVSLDLLLPLTTYHYKITSQTSDGETASTIDLTFTTPILPLGP
jgi:phosphodiesterase/alkaline phosphatase D-like protein